MSHARHGARGFQLIELMIAVALLGIAGVVLGNAALAQRRLSVELLQRERALQVLEAQADLAVRGAPANEAGVLKLVQELPGGALSERHGGGLHTFVITWRSAAGPQRLELSLVERGR